MKIQHLLPLCALALLLVPSPVHAQAGAAGRAALEVMEQLGKRGTTTATRELTELGGEVAVRELLQQAEKEGGEALVKSLSDQATKFGIVALQAAKGAPHIVVPAVEKLPKELMENGLRAIAREPVAMQKLISETGQEALEAAARHPGVGADIVKTLGKEGAETLAKLSDDAAVQLARSAPEIAALPIAQRSSLLAAMKTNTAKVLTFLEKHPKTLLTAAAVTAFLASKDELLGTNGAPGFIERVLGEPLRWGGFALAGILFLWGAMRLTFAYRGLRKKAAR